MAILPLDLIGDPASSLWARATDEELGIILPFFAQRPVPVGNIATSLGLKVLVDALDVNISGQIKKVEDAPAKFVITVNVADAPVRQRFTVAHEVGHYLLHRRLIDHEGIVDTILYRSSLSNRYEAEANKMAASLLLPWSEVTSWCQENYGSPPNSDNIKKVSDAFKVSDLTVGYRFNF